MPESLRPRRSRVILWELVAMPFGIVLFVVAMDWIFTHSPGPSLGPTGDASNAEVMAEAVFGVFAIGLSYLYLIAIGVLAGVSAIVVLAIIFGFSRGWRRASWVASSVVGVWLVVAIALGGALRSALT